MKVIFHFIWDTSCMSTKMAKAFAFLLTWWVTLGPELQKRETEQNIRDSFVSLNPQTQQALGCCASVHQTIRVKKRTRPLLQTTEHRRGVTSYSRALSRSSESVYLRAARLCDRSELRSRWGVNTFRHRRYRCLLVASSSHSVFYGGPEGSTKHKNIPRCNTTHEPQRNLQDTTLCVGCWPVWGPVICHMRRNPAAPHHLSPVLQMNICRWSRLWRDSSSNAHRFTGPPWAIK